MKSWPRARFASFLPARIQADADRGPPPRTSPTRQLPMGQAPGEQGGGRKKYVIQVLEGKVGGIKEKVPAQILYIHHSQGRRGRALDESTEQFVEQTRLGID
jgi:hypothetical protein